MDYGGEDTDYMARHVGAIAYRVIGDADAVACAARRLHMAMLECRYGYSGTLAALRDIGLRYADLAAMDSRGQFEAVFRALAAMPDQCRRMDAASRLMGRSGAQLDYVDLPEPRPWWRRLADNLRRKS